MFKQQDKPYFYFDDAALATMIGICGSIYCTPATACKSSVFKYNYAGAYSSNINNNSAAAAAALYVTNMTRKTNSILIRPRSII